MGRGERRNAVAVCAQAGGKGRGSLRRRGGEGGAGQTYRMVASGKAVAIHPSSSLGRHRPRCIIFAQLTRTTKDYAHDVTPIDPAWLHELAPAFMSRHRLPPPAPALPQLGRRS